MQDLGKNKQIEVCNSGSELTIYKNAISPELSVLPTPMGLHQLQTALDQVMHKKQSHDKIDKRDSLSSENDPINSSDEIGNDQINQFLNDVRMQIQEVNVNNVAGQARQQEEQQQRPSTSVAPTQAVRLVVIPAPEAAQPDVPNAISNYIREAENSKACVLELLGRNDIQGQSYLSNDQANNFWGDHLNQSGGFLYSPINLCEQL